MRLIDEARAQPKKPPQRARDQCLSDFRPVVHLKFGLLFKECPLDGVDTSRDQVIR